MSEQSERIRIARETRGMTAGEKIAGFVQSMVAFVQDDCTLVDEAEKQRRLDICATCPHKSGNGCRMCGCHLPYKVAGRAFHCPIEKW